MQAIKQLGNNGGGFLNANSSTTFENPTGLTNWLSIYLLLAVPFALTYTFGKMVGSIRHGAALLAAMVIIFGTWVHLHQHRRTPAEPRDSHGQCACKRGEHRGEGGALRLQRHRPLRVSSTSTSTGSADASYDSFTPSAAWGLLTGMMLG